MNTTNDNIRIPAATLLAAIEFHIEHFDSKDGSIYTRKELAAYVARMNAHLVNRGLMLTANATTAKRIASELRNVRLHILASLDVLVKRVWPKATREELNKYHAECVARVGDEHRRLGWYWKLPESN